MPEAAGMLRGSHIQGYISYSLPGFEGNLSLFYGGNEYSKQYHSMHQYNFNFTLQYSCQWAIFSSVAFISNKKKTNKQSQQQQ